MKITIFGSCRQLQPLSLLKNIELTGIQEKLTYTHYTKEVIQSIEFCNNLQIREPIDDKYTKYCFRTGILNNINIDCKDELKRDFDNTDLFVVEISSRYSYEWNNMYVHHILKDDEYKFSDKDNIIKRELSDVEIEEDIIKIKELLHPKKLLIVSHIYTYDSGKRYDLIKLLERLCLKYDIPFLSPSEYLNQKTDVYHNERKLSHFTEKGCSLISGIYKNNIKDIFKEKTLVLVLKQNYVNKKRSDINNFWGLGDMIRTMYGVYKKSLNSYFKVIIDISHHPIKNFIQTHTHKYTKLINDNVDNIEFCEEKYIDKKFENTNIICIGSFSELNVYDNSEYSNDINLFIKRHLRPTREFSDFINDKIKDIDINIIHYRLGDNGLINKVSNESIIEKCFDNLMKYSRKSKYSKYSKYILLTDSSLFKEYVIKKNENNENENIIVYNHSICHIGYDNSLDEIKNSLFEFFVATKSKSIKTYSTYAWISGFMFSIHKLYNVPITRIYLDENDENEKDNKKDINFFNKINKSKKYHTNYRKF
jgi:hypothetical protein